MSYFDTKKITLKNIWILLLTILLPIICVGGASTIPYMLRLPFIYAVGAAFVFVFVFSDIKITLSATSVTFLLLVSYIGISVFFSLDPKNSFNLFLVYLCAATLLFIDIPASAFQKILTVFYVVCAVISFSIIISVFIDHCMNNYFWFIVNPSKSAAVTKAINKELAIGSFSGFAREKGEAAYIMNVGLAISFSKYFSKGTFEKSELPLTLAFLAALILTGKRTMFLIPIICFCFFIVISKIKSKFFKFSSILVISLFAVFLIMMFVPELANIFNRFMDAESMTSMGNRDALWKYIYMMISKYWLFGGGFGSFNEFAYRHGLRVYNEKWDYNAHNSYLQILGELGVVGTILLAAFIISAFVLTVRLLKKAEEKHNDLSGLIYFSLYNQIMIVVYSVTGNPLYTKQILFVWLFSVGIVLSVNKTVGKRPAKIISEEFKRYG